MQKGGVDAPPAGVTKGHAQAQLAVTVTVALKHAASKSGFGEFGKFTCKKPSCFELMGWGLHSIIRQRASERTVAATYRPAFAMARGTC